MLTRRSYLILVGAVAAACGNLAPSSQAMPWLYGLQPAAVTDTPTEAAARDAIAHGTGAEAGYGAVEVTANVDGAAEPEVVIASYGLGVVVVDRAHRVIARAPAFSPSGSADAVIALAVGDAFIGAPVIAVAVQSGGHRENTVTLVMYRIGEHGALDIVFAAPVVEQDGDEARTGSVVMLPSRLAYRAPGTGGPSVWSYDISTNRYREQPR
jgi:hypothetical protein